VLVEHQHSGSGGALVDAHDDGGATHESDYQSKGGRT
jgi:hypothetical protein